MAGTKRIGMDLTEGGVTKKLILFSIPFMISTVLQTVYSMVDMIVVGQYTGAGGLSAVSLASQIAMLLTAISMGFSQASQILISQLVGAKARDRINTVIGTTFTSTIALGVFMATMCLILYKQMLAAVNVPQEAIESGAYAYLMISGVGLIFAYGYNMVSAVLRGLGDSVRPLVFIAIASILNIILDILFVGPLHMGAPGAALATAVSQAVSFLTSIVYLYHKREAFGFDFKPASFRVDGKVLLMLIKLGAPLALQGAAINISMLFVSRFVNDFGVAASATFGVGRKLEHLPNILTQGLGFAATAMIGQNIGANKYDRVNKTVHITLAFALLANFVFGFVFLAWPREMFLMFTDDAAVIDYAWLFMWTTVLGFPGHAMLTAYRSLIQGVGNSLFAMIIGLFDGVILRIGLSLLFGYTFHMGLAGFFLGYSLAIYGTGIPAMVYFYGGFWKRRKRLVD